MYNQTRSDEFMNSNEKQGVRSLENEHKEDRVLMVDIEKMLKLKAFASSSRFSNE
jgi:hypothetical protein